MSEYLIKNTTTGVGVGAYQKGDIVEERPDGTFDGMDHLHVIKVPGKVVGTIKADIADEQRHVTTVDEASGMKELLRRRKYSLTEAEFDKLFAAGTRKVMTEAEFTALVTDDKKLVDEGGKLPGATLIGP